ncbi:anaerobic ribonucleoside-triphosphate reductase activating protein [Candidatus Saccharibacteria bacterium]|nr:anaerobic ribonucleoside-triphosphate reductase activating protein [Candidatus Saccharibacteria bacterium]
MKLHLATEVPESITDGAGIRYSLYTQGCHLHCPGCHNPETWSFCPDAPGSYHLDTGDLITKIKKAKFSWGRLTLCGGDPIYQAPACIELIRRLKKLNPDYNVWAYTGLTFEHILEHADKENQWLEYLKCIDVLVDGPFILEQRDLTLPFRGSKNQRLIDVQRTIKKTLDTPYIVHIE